MIHYRVICQENKAQISGDDEAEFRNGEFVHFLFVENGIFRLLLDIE